MHDDRRENVAGAGRHLRPHLPPDEPTGVHSWVPSVGRHPLPGLSSENRWPRSRRRSFRGCSTRRSCGNWYATDGRGNGTLHVAELGIRAPKQRAACRRARPANGSAVSRLSCRNSTFATGFAPLRPLCRSLGTHDVHPVLKVSAPRGVTFHTPGRMPAPDGTLGVDEAARACGVSDETIRRRLRSRRFPHAVRDGGPSGAWRIPLADLVAAGFEPKLGTDGATSQGEVMRLREALAAAERLLEERRARIEELSHHVSDLRRLLGAEGALR